MLEDTEQLVTELAPVVVDGGLNLLGALAILIVGWIAAKWLGKKTYNVTQKSGKIDKTISHFASQVVKTLIIIVTILAVLGKFGVQTASIIAVLGAATLAIGLALQGTLSNVAAGVMLLIFRPFKVDDAVTVAGHSGMIMEIGIFTTIMKTFDGIHMNIPNGKIWGSEVTNFSINPTRRHDLVFGIGYGDDMDKALALVKKVLDEDERILKEPAALVVISNLGDSSVDITARPWTKSADFWAVKWDVTKKVKEAFDANGVSIPFPQRDIHLYQQK
ncbi:MAG: mechanosensitive ion channel [Bacteroidetes bacterium]|nr:mechanosensitive ion channel [Bacteroidota bacterium]